jgi:hypothetical protein
LLWRLGAFLSLEGRDVRYCVVEWSGSRCRMWGRNGGVAGRADPQMWNGRNVQDCVRVQGSVGQSRPVAPLNAGLGSCVNKHHRVGRLLPALACKAFDIHSSDILCCFFLESRRKSKYRDEAAWMTIRIFLSRCGVRDAASRHNPAPAPSKQHGATLPQENPDPRSHARQPRDPGQKSA